MPLTGARPPARPPGHHQLDQSGNADALATASMYEKAASAMREAISLGEVKTAAEAEQLEAGAKAYDARAAELRGSATASQLESAMAAAKVAGTAQQATANAGGGKQMAGTAAAGAAAGMFVVGAIGFPIAGAVLGAGALAYAAGMRPEGDAAGDMARTSGKVVANVTSGIVQFNKNHNITGTCAARPRRPRARAHTGAGRT